MTHKVTVATEGADTFRLSNAILIYRSGTAVASRHYATLHPVLNGRGGARLGAGSPATREACAGFVRALADESAFSGFIEPSMLYVAPRTVAWWRPPQPARVWFDTSKRPAGDQAAAQIGIRSGVTPHPGLVFALHDGAWFVAAVKGNQRPTPDAKLHAAPYFNVWKGGHICEGNIQRPDSVTPQTVARFERAFFESRFTHPNVSRLVRWKGGASAFWLALLDGKHKTFPERALLPLNTTLARWLKKLEDHR